MIPANCRRLAEADFPLALVSGHSAEEKDKKTGTMASTHKWWARRPTSSCRAILLSCILPDTDDPACPDSIKTELAAALAKHGFGRGVALGEKPAKKRASLRSQLLGFVGEFAGWDARQNSRHVACARDLAKISFGRAPVVLDPFAGGGSIPLEACRVGCESIATDINPIPILLNRLQLEQLPRLNDAGFKQLLKSARSLLPQFLAGVEKDVSAYYRRPPNSRPAIGYLCARVVQCESSACGVRYPLLSSPWASSKSKEKSVGYKLRGIEDGEVRLDVVANPRPGEVIPRTAKEGGSVCPLPTCGHEMSRDSVSAQLARRGGGSNDAMLVAVIEEAGGRGGRRYRAPGREDIEARNAANSVLENPQPFPFSVPDEPLPPAGSLGMRVQPYGMTTWGSVMSPRQLATQIALVKGVREIRDETLRLVYALAASQFANRNSTLCQWTPEHEFFLDTFKSQRIQMTWDFYEPVPFTEGGANFSTTFENVLRGLQSSRLPEGAIPGKARFGDAAHHPLPDESVDIWGTDPPYYDEAPYSDISNYFVVWLRRMLDGLVLEREIAPREAEIIQDPKAISKGKAKTAAWYEHQIELALREGYRVTRDDGVGFWVYAHKSTEGWATALGAMIRAGWAVTGSWPISTERATRFRAQNSAALTTSVHIILRKRTRGRTSTGEWSDVQAQLPTRIRDWLTRLASEGVHGADAIFACIGPAMELFSKWDTVERADGSHVKVEDFLDVVWHTVAAEALRLLDPQHRTSALDAGSRFAVMAIWTLRQNAGAPREEENGEQAPRQASTLALPFDAASLLARALGVSLEDLNRDGIVDFREVKKNKVVAVLSARDRASSLVTATTRDARPPGPIQARITDEPSPKATIVLPVRQPPKLVEPKYLIDVVHQSMVLFDEGATKELDGLIDARFDDPSVLAVAQTLNSLFPPGSWERTRIEGVIARVTARGVKS